jgi:hypothetical protein
MALTVALWAAHAVVAPHRLRASPLNDGVGLVTCSVIAGAVGAVLTRDVIAVVLPLCLFLGLAGLLRSHITRLSGPGVAWLTIELLTLVVGWIWGVSFLIEESLPFALRVLALIGMTLSLGFLIAGRLERIAREALLTHAQWKRPTTAPSVPRSTKPLKVSIHLPCYAEPPEVVMAVMDRLAGQFYDDYEVLVCDNNTKDEALWRPLEAHCARLNAIAGKERFRFFHVAPLAGAKAGALNFLLEQMAPDTDIVAVVDADYLAQPHFLSRLLPFFDDPKIGFLQTPHDYRDYEDSAYLTGCYWEYMPNNKVDMPGVSEYGGAFTIGTMCLIRAEPLKSVGGWAEWCLTEDSEVSVRLREAGYHGIYIGETFGRGLIPQTFDDYKKQRFRWTAGPVQQLRRHWRLLLPAPFAKPMPGWTKLLEVLRCMAPLQSLVGLTVGLMMLAATCIGIATGAVEKIDIPGAAWVVIGLGVVTWLVRLHHRYRLSGCTRFADMVRGEVARSSLTYVVLVSGVAGLSKKPFAWRRTPKFDVEGAQGSAFAEAMPETVLGTICAALMLLVLANGDAIGWEFAILTTISLATLSFRFFCAPYMASLALADARERGKQAQLGEPDVKLSDWALSLTGGKSSAVAKITPQARSLFHGGAGQKQSLAQEETA